MAEQGLADKVGQRLEDWFVNALTGEPPKGSDQDLQKQIQTETLKKQLADLQKNPNDPNTVNSFLETLKTAQGLSTARQRDSNETNLQYFSDPRLLQAANSKADIEIRKNTAKTGDEINLLEAEAQQRMLGLDKITDHEWRLAGGSQADTNNAVLSFLERAHDKNLAAQKEARRPNIPALLGGLGATALSLFA